MRTPVPAFQTIRASHDRKVVVHLEGKLMELVEEAMTGPRGYVVFIERDKHGMMVSQNNKPVYKTLRGDVTAWYVEGETKVEANV